MPFGLIFPLAFLMDILAGDPPGYPHPVVLMGRLIALQEGLIRRFVPKGIARRLAGLLMTLSVVGVTFFAARLLVLSAEALHPLLGGAVSSTLLYTTISVRGLALAAGRVYRAIALGDLVEARRCLSRIVSRDTEQLSRGRIIRGTVESVAENTSDGVVAPLFFALIGGPELALAYKAVNTLDSMVGYRTQEYLELGWAPARLDDLANYIPARLTAGLTILAAGLSGRDPGDVIGAIRNYGQSHDSPNSGYPEAGFAGALGLWLAGPTSYGGVLRQGAYIGDGGAEPSGEHIRGAVELLYLISLLMITLITVFTISAATIQ